MARNPQKTKSKTRSSTKGKRTGKGKTSANTPAKNKPKTRKGQKKKAAVKSPQTQPASKLKLNHIIAIIMAIPTLLLLTQLSADYIVFKDEISQVQAELDEYYFSGWPVGSLREKFHEQYSRNQIYNFSVEPLRERDTDYYLTELHKTIDYETDSLFNDISETRAEAGKYYIPQIAQPTDSLESYLRDIEEGIACNNHFIIERAQEKIPAELEALEALQNASIKQKLDQKVNDIRNIAFMGSRYGIGLDSYISQAEQIANRDGDPVQKFLELYDLKHQAGQQVDQRIIARGGWATDGKRIFIVIGSQRLYMIEDYSIIYEMPAATGIHGHGTAAGEFKVYDKTDVVWGYYEIWMPYWITIYYSGGLKNGIHGLPWSPNGAKWWFWDDDIGIRPVTYGCVMPHDADAKIVYDWADVGIPVSIVY